ncbi:NAC domain-containing protein 78-like [Capsicum annuum]|uniref:NAC domain-containing protein 78-like n=1 Tax=Capsicum annuum TaxID=4072 RepID=UPI0007BF9048|nr:NAC domain-containing protein 78-like [Capsicum annuum]XP_047261586.1 NAC domain-containing protein 78-like [Capsicum annuum]
MPSCKSKQGFRFHPIDEELMKYLNNFVLHGIFPPRDFINVADLFEDSEPWEIMVGSAEKTRYFLSRLKRLKNSTKKQSQRSDPIRDGSKKNITIGYKSSLKYVNDIEKDAKLLMKEYLLPDHEYKKSSKDKDIYVICKIKEVKKRIKGLDGGRS